MQAETIDTIFAQFAANNPEPKTELYSVNTFTLLVAVVLSAQATDAGVNKATPALFAVADNPKDMLALGVDGLKHYIKTIGLFNSKANNIIALCQRMLDVYGGEVPRTREELETLAGVGRKTANVLLNCAWGEPTMAVDTHVFRVSNRIGLTQSQNPLQTEKQLLACIPQRWMQHAHHWLILHGRYVCKARKPLCGECSIRQWCEFEGKG